MQYRDVYNSQLPKLSLL